MNAARACAAVGLALALLVDRRARAADEPAALFALIVGVNRSVDRDLPPLAYADDDAARYHDLFRSLGARTYLLTRPDENTRRISPQAVAEARDPTQAELTRALAAFSTDVAQARARGVRTVFYFVYAGHGNSADGETAYLALEDARLPGAELGRTIIDAVHADQAHVIVDACYSYLLVYGRGPGGRRRELHGFTALGDLAMRPNVGLLLSTSSAQESHEWEAFQAGVFSHEVRSGLYGAADADGDGQVSYREIGAFIARANAAIPNERFRPQVFARPPLVGPPAIVDLRRGLERRLLVDADAAQAHYLLEDLSGNRLADFHKTSGQAVSLLRPAAAGVLFLRRLSDDREFEIPPSPAVVRVSELVAVRPRATSRGAAHHAFSRIFALPFDESAVLRYQLPPARPAVDEREALPRWRTLGATGAFVLAAAATAGGAGLLLDAHRTASQAKGVPSQREAAAFNQRVESRNLQAGLALGVAASAAVTGALFLLWPERGVRDLALVAGGDAHGAVLGFARPF
jgi:hypothetical protein